MTSTEFAELTVLRETPLSRFAYSNEATIGQKPDHSWRG